ncbi:hypothetical protein ACE1OC_19360 [Streptomyces sp. DSM 116496]|uniref:hypothetical protein n=1 Tax=Streptomyces stoeckheimensis TaxID=3344656 RepID=UPI0038B2AEE7
MSLPAPPSPEPGPFLTVHTALVLMMATFIGLVVGGLTFLSGGPIAGAILAGLTASGASILALRTLIR